MDETSRQLEELAARGRRYPLDAYLFILAALEHMLQRLGERRHLTGQELSEGIRTFALERYGLMARTVLESWNCHTTDDFGNLVYDMIGAGIMSKTPEDRLEDFHAVYDFGAAFERGYELGQSPE
jgi:uncharacterized repeat protein (TIGR04138 family)